MSKTADTFLAIIQAGRLESINNKKAELNKKLIDLELLEEFDFYKAGLLDQVMFISEKSFLF